MEKKYEKYKEPIKKWCVIQTISYAVAFVAAILVIFVPNFLIDLTKISFTDTTLPKLFDLSEEAFESGKLNFSVFDEIRAAFEPAGEKGGSVASIVIMAGIFQLFGAIFLGIGLVFCLVALIRGIMHILSPGDYVLYTYDEWKRKVDKKSVKAGNLSSPTHWIICGFIYEILAIFFSKFLNNLSEEKVLTSYFTALSGISAAVIFTIVVMAGTLAVVIAANMQKKKIKMDILKEEYETAKETIKEG